MAFSVPQMHRVTVRSVGCSPGLVCAWDAELGCAWTQTALGVPLDFLSELTFKGYSSMALMHGSYSHTSHCFCFLLGLCYNLKCGSVATVEASDNDLCGEVG